MPRDLLAELDADRNSSGGRDLFEDLGVEPPNPPSTAGQVAKGLADKWGEGSGNTVSGVGRFLQAPAAYALEAVTGLAAAVSDEDHKPGRQELARQVAEYAQWQRDENLNNGNAFSDAGKRMEDVGTEAQRHYQNEVKTDSPMMVRQSQAISDASGFFPKIAAMLANPLGTAGTVMQSAPDMAIGAAAGRVVGGAAQANALRKGATAADAVAAGENAAGSAGLVTEAAQSGMSNRAQVEQFVLDQNPADLYQHSEYFRRMVGSPDNLKDPAKVDAAKRQLANSLGAESSLLASLFTGTGSKISGAADAVGKTVMGGRMSFGEALSRAGKEGFEEAMQNPGENYAQYRAQVQADPNQKYDFGGSVAEGLVTGGAMGAGMHGSGYASGRLSKEQPSQVGSGESPVAQPAPITDTPAAPAQAPVAPADTSEASGQDPEAAPVVTPAAPNIPDSALNAAPSADPFARLAELELEAGRRELTASERAEAQTLIDQLQGEEDAVPVQPDQSTAEGPAAEPAADVAAGGQGLQGEEAPASVEQSGTQPASPGARAPLTLQTPDQPTTTSVLPQTPAALPMPKLSPEHAARVAQIDSRLESIAADHPNRTPAVQASLERESGRLEAEKVAIAQQAQQAQQQQAKAPRANQSPVMKRGDLVGAIMRVTGGRGIAASMAQTVTGDTANKVSKLRGLFTRDGVQDLDDTATLLRVQEGYDVRDGEHLAELLREAAAGNVAVSMERTEREAAENEQKQYKADVIERAKRLKVKHVGRKFADVEQDVHEAERLEIKADAAAEREAIQSAEELVSDLTDDEINRLLQEAFDREGKFIHGQRIDNEALWNAIEPIAEDEEQKSDSRPGADQSGEEVGRATERSGEARPGEDRDAAGRDGQVREGDQAGRQGDGAPDLALTGQTNEEAAAEFAKQQQGEPELTKDQIDREAAGFSLQQESQASAKQAPTGGQGGLFTADGRATAAAGQPGRPERGEIGKALTKEQRKSVLNTLVDVYKANGLQKELKGLDARGEEVYGYPYSPELFVKSDITGAMVRYYVTMPDGKVAHPTELFPDYTQSEIDVALAQQKRAEEDKALSDKWRKESLENRMAGDLNTANSLFWRKNPALAQMRDDDYVPAILSDGSRFVRTDPITAENDAQLLGGDWKVTNPGDEGARFRKAAKATEAEATPTGIFEQADTGFVKAPNGSIDFGEITQDMAATMRRQAGKIRLEKGDGSYGLQHIEERHGSQIRGLGFESVEAFVADAVGHIESIWKPKKTTQLVMLQAAEKGKAVFIELKPADSGDYYTVNTAFPVGKHYAENKGWRLLWGGASVPTEASGANPLAEPSPNAGATATMTPGQSSNPSIDGAPLDGNAASTAESVIRQADAIEPAEPEVRTEQTSNDDMLRANGQKNQIADFGEKIGGARKDKAVPTGPRQKMPKAEDERPAWARKFHVMQLAEGRYTRPEHVGKWQIMQEAGGPKGAVKPASRQMFDTEQQALDAIPLVAVGQRHAVYHSGSGDSATWGIYRNITDRKRALVKGGFETRDEAMGYMAEHPAEIIEHKFQFPERPWLDRIERTGPERRTSDVTTQMFQDTFGFRGGEFGNWNMGGDGQAALNHAYDALLDLADAIGVPPKAISLNGELAIAFGARGTGGKNSAAAHYEPGHIVINLTKIKGAGSAAHEWWHAVDHYFARNGGRKESDSVVSGGYPYNSQARPELIQAIKGVVDAMMNAERSTTTDADLVRQRAQKRIDEAVRDLDYRLRDLRNPYDPKRPYTPDQLKRFDELSARLRDGDMGEEVYIQNPSKMRGAMGFATGSVIRDLNDLYKSVSGRSFLRQDPQSAGRQMHWIVKSIADNKANLAVREDVTTTSKGRSDFYIEAKRIDGYRTGDYWSTPEEMGARAFESYIFDKLTAGELRSDYLVYAVENRFYSALDMKPYPEGDERERIDAAFDNLFQTIEKQETDKGVSLNDLASDQDLATSRAIDRAIARMQGNEVSQEKRQNARLALTRLRKRHEAGKVSDGEFIMRVEQIHAKMEERAAERRLKEPQERARGADYIRQKILEAKRHGGLSEEAANLAEWFILKNPALVDELGISIRTPNDSEAGSRGQYLPLTQIIRLFKGSADTLTAVHEVLHHLERMMPSEMQDAIRKEWMRRITKAQVQAARDGNGAMLHFLDDVLEAWTTNSQEAVKRMTKAIQGGKLPAGSYQLFNPSEFWAVNMADLVGQRFAAKGSTWGRIRQWVKEAVQHIKGALRLQSDAPMLKALDALIKNGDGSFQSKDMLGKSAEYNSVAGDVAQMATDWWQEAKSTVQQLTSRESMDSMIYNFQDKMIDLKRLRERIHALQGTVTDLNDAYLGEELYHGRVAKRTEDFLSNELKPLMADLRARGVKVDEFEEFLHARHAPEANAELARRNPNQQEIDTGRQKAAADMKALATQLQSAQAAGSATKAIEQALNKARGELASWNGAQAFKGTEAERLSLSGMTDSEAASVMAKIPADRRQHLDALAARVDAINAKTLDTLEQYGLMDKASLDAWRKAYQHYVPLHRDEAHPDSYSHPVGQGFSVKGDASKRRTGSNEKVTHILGHIAMQRESALTRGEKNNVTKKLYLMASQNPDRDFWMVDRPPTIKTVDKATGFVRSSIDPLYKSKPNVVMLRIAGKDAAVVFNEHNKEAVRLAGALKNLDAGDLHAVLGLAAKGTRWFASVNTQYNPIFGLINLARDAQEGIINLSSTAIADKKAQVAKGIIPALKAVFGVERGHAKPDPAWAKLWEDFQEVGGQTGYRDLYAKAEDRSKALLKELKVLDRWKVTKAVHWMVDWLSDYNAAMENAVRLSAYKAGLDKGLSKERAASIAKNLTVNFNRKGAQTREIGALYAFFNAALQGTARMAETLKGPLGRKIIYGGVALGIINTLSGMLLMGGGDDDNWEKIPEFVKSNSFIIPISHEDYITIPMPLGFRFLPNIGRIATEFALGGKDKTAGRQIGKLLSVLADSFNPFGGGSDFGQTVTPTVFDPVLALYRNKDWTGKPIYRENRNANDPQPGHALAKDSASSVSRELAKAINDTTGGNEYRPGAWSPTPDQLDYVFGQMTGGLGREVMKVDQTVSSLVTGDELPPHKVPLLGRLYGNTSGPSGNSDKFNENVRELNEIENEAKGRAKDRNGFREYLQSEPKTNLIAAGNAAENQVQKLRSYRRDVVRQGLPGYKDEVRKVDDRIGEVMKGLNRKMAAQERGG